MPQKIIILLCSLFVFSSCQDSKSKKTLPQKNSKIKQKAKKPEKEVTIASMKSQSEVDIDSIHTVNQVHLIPFLTKYGKENPETHVLISTNFGDIEVKLFKDTPLHRANFIHLVKIGYFNTTYFHRVAKGFVIQGGNSDNKTTQKMRRAVGDFLIPKEFSKHHLHNRGAFSAAKFIKQNVSKASSPFEFFIVLNEKGAHHLDFEHTVFGKVIKGMDVADSISKVEVDAREWPLENVYIKAKVLE